MKLRSYFRSRHLNLPQLSDTQCQKLLKEALGPLARIVRCESYGVRGARVVVGEKVLCQVFSQVGDEASHWKALCVAANLVDPVTADNQNHYKLRHAIVSYFQKRQARSEFIKAKRVTAA